LAFIGNITHTG